MGFVNFEIENGLKHELGNTNFSMDQLQSNKALSPISVVIPTRNEAPRIALLINRLRAMPEVHQIIVSDGGSDDETVAIAQDAGAKVLYGAHGRGAQLNAGARQALNEPIKVLWFLHADALPHPKSGEDIARAIHNIHSPRIIGGNFRLKFDSDRRFARFVEQIARWQRRRGVFYGDSGMWVRSEAWRELDGFSDWPLFEDLDFARRLQTLAEANRQRLKYLHRPLLASARRFEARPWHTLGLWIALQTLFNCGVLPQRLAAIYHRRK